MAGLQRSSKPHPDCRATKEELLNKKKNPLDVDEDCPICLQIGLLCSVGCHPSSASSAGKSTEACISANPFTISTGKKIPYPADTMILLTFNSNNILLI